MVPTMIVFGLVLGRWWRSAILFGTAFWMVVVAAVTGASTAGALGAAAAVGAINATAGAAAHQGGLWLVRRARRAGWSLRRRPRAT